MWFKRVSDTNLTVSATIGGVIQYFSVNDDNKLVLQRAELPNNLLPNVLAVYASGKGCALLQVRIFKVLCIRIFNNSNWVLNNGYYK
jgi:hypothetical protein